MAEKTVLLVEDNWAERRLLLHGLRSRYRVLEAEGVEAAVEQLAAEAVDLVLLDLHLHADRLDTASGIALHKLLSEARPRLPVVVLTGDADPAVESVVRSRGVSEYLHKPAVPEVVREAVAHAMERMERGAS